MLTIPRGPQPYLADELGASSFQISALVGTFSFGQLVGNVVMGQLSDRIGRKPIVLMSLAASTVSYVICGLAGALPVLFLARNGGGGEATPTPPRVLCVENPGWKYAGARASHLIADGYHAFGVIGTALSK